MLREHDLTLENSIKHCKAADETTQHAKILQHQLHSEKAAVHAVKKKPLQNTNRLRLMIILKTVNFVQALTNAETVQQFQRKKVLKRMVTFLNIAPKQKSVNQVQKGQTTSQSSDNDDEDDEFFIGSISAEVEVDDTPIINDDSDCYSPDNDDVTATVMSTDGDDHFVNFSEWSVVLNTNGSDISYKIDFGAQVNILQKRNYILYKTDPV